MLFNDTDWTVDARHTFVTPVGMNMFLPISVTLVHDRVLQHT